MARTPIGSRGKHAIGQDQVTEDRETRAIDVFAARPQRVPRVCGRTLN